MLCAIARRSLAREGKTLRGRLGKKIKKIKNSLKSYVYTTQVGCFMADSRQNGLKYSCSSRTGAAYRTP